MTETTSETRISASADGAPRRLRHLIAGRWLPGGGPEIVDTNPKTATVYLTAPAEAGR
jgi:hypothetical protein